MHGAPQAPEGTFGSSSAFIHREGGAVVVGEPHVASSGLPANDHPDGSRCRAVRAKPEKPLVKTSAR